ncbi:MAG TPA: Uma2 family endonuclease [Methylomirabilota bacterium]|nr:Uma2 family endonuclease [Methylomirabilota bacterium]
MDVDGPAPGGYRDAMRAPAVRERRWTRKEYGGLIGIGFFDEDRPDNRVELIEGRMIVAEPQNTPHAIACELAAEALRAAFGAGWRVRMGLPIGLDPDSEPEPDVALIRGAPRDSLADHPSTAALVVEVADTRLRFDRAVKGRLYAGAGIADYWIVNLRERVVEVYREPVRGARGARYSARHVTRSGETITPLAAPDARIAVDDLLP